MHNLRVRDTGWSIFIIKFVLYTKIFINDTLFLKIGQFTAKSKATP